MAAIFAAPAQFSVTQGFALGGGPRDLHDRTPRIDDPAAWDSGCMDYRALAQIGSKSSAIRVDQFRKRSCCALTKWSA